MNRRLGATQRLGVALAASLLLHLFLFAVAAIRLSGFSFGSEKSWETDTHAVTLTFSRKLSVPDEISIHTLDPQTPGQPESEDANVPHVKPAADNFDRPGGGLYTPLGLLTKLPQPIGDIDLNSPEIINQARQTHISLLLFVSKSGLVDDVKIVSVDGGNEREVWIASIVARFRQSRFMPGEIDGKPVSTEFPITVVVD